MREPLFVVSPPRSYTSVVGGILGQHPQSYGLPELNMSHADTLGELWDPIPAMADLSMAGLLRLLAQLHEGNQTEEAVQRARQWVLRRGHWPTAKVFAHLQEAIGPDRIMVEKSPRNTFKVENLRRLLRIFPRASFLHLTRHPQTQGKSSMELRKTFGGDNVQSVDPEKVWMRSQMNILEFSRDLATGQCMRIKGEMLLREPHFYLRQICEWLDIDQDEASIEAMLHPEASPYANIGPPSAPFGNDPNFLTNPELDFARLARIKEPPLLDEVGWRPGETFSKPVLRMARQFGYT